MTTNEDPRDPRLTPSAAAESEEQEVVERTAAERGRAVARHELDDPREEEGWTQPESSAQKGAIQDEG
jgi:hypothetical protein